MADRSLQAGNLAKFASLASLFAGVCDLLFLAKNDIFSRGCVWARAFSLGRCLALRPCRLKTRRVRSRRGRQACVSLRQASRTRIRILPIRKTKVPTRMGVLVKAGATRTARKKNRLTSVAGARAARVAAVTVAAAANVKLRAQCLNCRKYLAQRALQSICGVMRILPEASLVGVVSFIETVRR